jgi:hypothetical protein
VYPKFAFHPRDYVFYGHTKNVTEVFDIPLDETTGGYDEWNDVRAETYIGMWYYRKFDKVVDKFIQNPLYYLTDKSEGRIEALEVYHRLLLERKGFIPLPRCDIELPKHYPHGYPFEYLRNLYGEVYDGDSWSFIKQERGGASLCLFPQGQSRGVHLPC